jgi:MFS family permease
MYQVENAARVVAQHRETPRAARRLVGRTVLALGLTSMFTDVSSEMVTAVLPLYLVFGLHASPLAFGAVDGLYTGATAPVRLLGGVLADRGRRHKAVAVAGYGLSTLARAGMVVVGGAWTALAGLVLVDRLGKGVRTAPRDAMISLSTPREQWGVAFGVHRALDMAGAVAGPVLTFAVLAAAPGRYDAVFVVSLCAALVGLGVVVLFVPAHAGPGTRAATVTWRAVGGLLRRPGVGTVLAAATLLALTTLGDSFLYLALQERVGFALGLFPLLYVATSGVFTLLAVPVGRVADRVGRRRVFIGGHLALIAVYAVLLTPVGAGMAGIGVAGIAVVALGAYYAATDGVVMALTAEALPDALRGSGMALVTTATSVARLCSSLLFGLVWTVAGVRPALAVFAAGLGVSIVVGGLLLARPVREQSDVGTDG